MTLGMSLNFSPIKGDNNANHEVNVSGGLDTGAKNNSHTYTLGVQLQKKEASCLPGGSSSHNLQDEMLIQGHTNSF